MLVKPLVVPTKSLALLLARRESASCFALQDSPQDGKEHRAWSVVENGAFMTAAWFAQVFYLGEINDSQRAAWSKAIEVFDEGAGQSKQITLFPRIALRRFSIAMWCRSIERDAAAPASSVGRLLDATLLWISCGWTSSGWRPCAFARRNKMAEHLKTLVSYQLISPGSE